MKPIAITQHHAEDGPSYFATFLQRAGLRYQVFRLDQGEAPPADIRDYAGFCILGGPMSADDELPYLLPEMRLIREAIRADIPVIGHCLGGQLMAKALGGTVQAAENVEIGWAELEVSTRGRKWFGERDAVRLFQWHGESFSIPKEAERIAFGRHCANQAFLYGKHLGMQFHCEVDVEKVRLWIEQERQELQRNVQSPGVQPAEQLLATLAQDIAASQRVADDIYTRWIQGLRG